MEDEGGIKCEISVEATLCDDKKQKKYKNVYMYTNTNIRIFQFIRRKTLSY